MKNKNARYKVELDNGNTIEGDYSFIMGRLESIYLFHISDYPFGTALSRPKWFECQVKRGNIVKVND